VSNPRKFCHFVHAECTRLGLKTVYGRPAAIEQQTSLTVTLNDGTAEELPFAGLLLSAGPWTTAVAKKLRLACPLTGNLPGHSIHIAPSPGWSNDFVGKSIFAGITDETEDSVDAIAWSDGEQRDAPGGRGCTPSVELVSRWGSAAHK
jgi:glycine/D-amino acid oxidase-like deaminating enzyme